MKKNLVIQVDSNMTETETDPTKVCCIRIRSEEEFKSCGLTQIRPEPEFSKFIPENLDRIQIRWDWINFTGFA